MSNEPPIEKRCSKCGETKPVEAFYKKKTSGYESHCKACKAEYGKKRYEANAEAICKHQKEYRAANIEMLREREAEPRRLYMRKYQQVNAEKLNQQRKDRRSANPEKYRQIQNAWRAANAEHLREYRKKYGAAYRAANKAKFLEYGRRYRETHVEYMREYMRRYLSEHPETNRVKRHRRRTRMNGNDGHFTGPQIREMRMAQAGICAYCKGQHHPGDLHIDHIVPVNQGGSNNISNICLACPTCNYSKGDRTPEQWTNRWYLRKRNDTEDKPEE